MTSMLSNVIVPVLTAAVGFLSGYVSASYVSFRRVRAGKHDALKPEFDPHPFGGRWRGGLFRVALTAMFVVATTFTVAFSVQQRGCNEEFQRTIVERAAVTTDNDRARKENDQAVAALVTGFLAITPGSADARARSRELLEQFTQTMADNNSQQEGNERRRAENPYPRC
jgi:hypothetical protein